MFRLNHKVPLFNVIPATVGIHAKSLSILISVVGARLRGHDVEVWVDRVPYDWARTLAPLFRHRQAIPESGFLRQPVQFARRDVALNLRVPQACLQFLKPFPELGKLLARQPLDGFLEVFQIIQRQTFQRRSANSLILEALSHDA